MTLLEILVERLDGEAEWAIQMAAYSRDQSRPARAEYYHGQAAAFGRTADMLRQVVSGYTSVPKEEAE